MTTTTTKSQEYKRVSLGKETRWVANINKNTKECIQLNKKGNLLSKTIIIGKLSSAKPSFKEALLQIVTDNCQIVKSIIDFKFNSRTIHKKIITRFSKVQIQNEEDYDNFENLHGNSMKKALEKNKKNITKWKTQNKKLTTKTVKWNDEIDIINNVIIVKGYVQSGKTNCMISTAVAKFIDGQSTIIVLNRKLSDMAQIKKRITEYNVMVQRQLKLIGIAKKDVPFDIEYLDSNFEQSEFEQSMIHTVNKQPKIFVVLGNPSQIKRINSGFEKLRRRNINPLYNIMIDECDLLDSSGTSTSMVLEPLKFHAQMVMLVSATIMDNLMKEHIKKETLFLLPRPDMDIETFGSDKIDYRGIETFKTHCINDKAIPCNKITDNPFINDPGMKDFLFKWCNKSPRSMCDYKVPVMMLMNIGKALLPQEKLFKFIKNKYSDQTAVILLNGQGIKIFHSGLPKKSFNVNTILGKVESNYKKHVHYLKNVSISDIYLWLKENGGVSKFPRIITIAGHLASRGISFNCNVGKFLKRVKFRKRIREKDIAWYTQSLYYLASKSTDQAELIQNAGRVCTIASRSARFSVKLYVVKSIKKSIIKALYLQDDLIEQARKLMMRKRSKYFKKSINRVPIFKEKIANGHSITKKGKCILSIVSDPRKDKGLSINEYEYDLKIYKRKARGTYDKIERKAISIVEENNDKRLLQEGEYIFIDPSHLSNYLAKYYKMMINSIKHFRKTKTLSKGWISRVNITKYLVETKNQVTSGINARMTEIVKSQPKKNINTPSDTNGLFIKKAKGILFVKYC